MAADERNPLHKLARRVGVLGCWCIDRFPAWPTHLFRRLQRQNPTIRPANGPVLGLHGAGDVLRGLGKLLIGGHCVGTLERAFGVLGLVRQQKQIA